MPHELFSDTLYTYIDGLVPPRHAELEAMEAYAARHDFPIIGPACGYFCYQIARMLGARRIFEMGSGYGYSTAWFARAVQEQGGGEVYHTVWDQQLSQQARKHLDVLGYQDIVHYTVGEATQTLRDAQGPFDLIFNDIDKQGYPGSLAVIAEKLRPGGVLIIDNMLWHGQIFDPNDQHASTRGVHEVTRMLTRDPEWISSLIPLRDGLIVAYRQ